MEKKLTENCRICGNDKYIDAEFCDACKRYKEHVDEKNRREAREQYFGKFF